MANIRMIRNGITPPLLRDNKGVAQRRLRKVWRMIGTPPPIFPANRPSGHPSERGIRHNPFLPRRFFGELAQQALRATTAGLHLDGRNSAMPLDGR